MLRGGPGTTGNLRPPPPHGSYLQGPAPHNSYPAQDRQPTHMTTKARIIHCMCSCRAQHLRSPPEPPSLPSANGTASLFHSPHICTGLRCCDCRFFSNISVLSELTFTFSAANQLRGLLLPCILLVFLKDYKKLS